MEMSNKKEYLVVFVVIIGLITVFVLKDPDNERRLLEATIHNKKVVERNENARYLEKNYPVLFKATILYHAYKEYDDSKTSEYIINVESDMFMKLYLDIDSMKADENINLLKKTIYSGSHPGYRKTNKILLQNIEKVSISNLLKCHCFWSMVVPDYFKYKEEK